MANKRGIIRKDSYGTHKPRKYKLNYDESGKKKKENMVIRAFWRENKVVDMIKLSPKQLDKVIDAMLEKYQARQLKNNPNWWYPELDGKTLNELRNNKRLDKEDY